MLRAEPPRALGIEPVSVEHAHTLAVAVLPLLHREPFDRLLVARALDLGLAIATADDQLARYGVPAVLVGAPLP